MKSTFTFLALIASLAFYGQQILPNHGFENWTTNTLWYDPIPFGTSNMNSYFSAEMQGVTMSANTHSGNGAVKLQVTNAQQPIAGMISHGIADGNSFTEPIAFYGTPDSLAVWANFDIATGDAGNITIRLYSEGVECASATITFTGSSNGYQRISVPVLYNNQDFPDHMGMIATCSDISSPNMLSSVILDDLQFIYNEIQGSEIPGGDFEMWNEATVTDADGWNNSNMLTYPATSVSPSGGAYSGQSCARIETQHLGIENSSLGFVYLGNMIDEETCNEDEMTINGTQFPFKISGFYKYAAGAVGDSASVYLSYKTYNEETQTCDSLLEFTMLYPQTDTIWTPFMIIVPGFITNQWLLGDGPEYFNLGFASTKIPMNESATVNGPLGSVLWIDDVSINYWGVTNGVDEEATKKTIVYPNPANDQFRIGGLNASYTTATITDINGRTVLTVNSNEITKEINTSSLVSGTYFVKIIDKAGATVLPLIVQH